MSGQMLPAPEQMIDLVGHAAAVKLAMDGKFDEKIAALKEAAAALEEKTGIAKTVEDAKALRDLAEAEAKKLRDAAADAMDKARSAIAEAEAKLSTVTARETAVATLEAQLNARANELNRREAVMADAHNTKDQELREKKQQLIAFEATLNSKHEKLAADLAAFGKKIDAYNALRV